MAQLRFFDPPAPPYFNVGTKRMTVKIRSMNNLTPFQSQGVTTRLIFSLFYDWWPDWPEEKMPIPGHGLTGPTGSYTPENNLSNWFSMPIYVGLATKIVQNGHKKRYFSKYRIFPRSKMGVAVWPWCRKFENLLRPEIDSTWSKVPKSTPN